MADRYWVGSGGNWTDTANWSTTSGGSGGSSVPTSSDNTYFDANSGDCVLNDQYHGVLDLDFTGYTGTFSSGLNYRPTYIYGNLVLDTGMTWGTGMSTRDFEFQHTTGTKTITSNGEVFPADIVVDNSGTVQLADAANFNRLICNAGTFDSNSQSLTLGSITVAGAANCDLGSSGTITLSSGSGGTTISVDTTGTLTFTGVTFDCTDWNQQVYLNDEDLDAAGLTALKVFCRYGTTTPAINSDGAAKLSKLIVNPNAEGTSPCYINGSMTIVDLQFDKACTFKGNVSDTLTVTNSVSFTRTTNDLLIRLVSGIGQWTFDYTGSGDVDLDYVDVSDNNGTPASTWYAGANGTDTSNNTGWTFTAAPAGTPVVSEQLLHSLNNQFMFEPTTRLGGLLQ